MGDIATELSRAWGLRCSIIRSSPYIRWGEALTGPGSETINLAELELVKSGMRERVPLRITSTISTARCGSACRVVWEGCSSQELPPIPMAWRKASD